MRFVLTALALTSLLSGCEHTRSQHHVAAVAEDAEPPCNSEALRQEGLRNFSQDWFGASKNQTVTKFISAAGVPVVQLEVNSTWMLPRCSEGQCEGLDGVQPQRFAQLLQGLVRFIRQVDSSGGRPPCPSGT